MDLINNSTPKVESNMAIIILLVNFFFPGIGTLLAGIMTQETEKKNPAIIVGIIQFILASFLIGWLWAIYWGYKIYAISK